jgi:hypothetical protein
MAKITASLNENLKLKDNCQVKICGINLVGTGTLCRSSLANLIEHQPLISIYSVPD